MGESASQYALSYVAGRALGVTIDPAAFLSIIALTHALKRVLMSLDRWNASEALSILLYGLLGVRPEVAVGMTLLRHAAMASASAPVALLLPANGARRPLPRALKAAREER